MHGFRSTLYTSFLDIPILGVSRKLDLISSSEAVRRPKNLITKRSHSVTPLLQAWQDESSLVHHYYNNRRGIAAMSFIDCTFGNVHIYLNIYNALTRTVLELDVLRFHTIVS
ncbi:hypothetical protein AFLA_004934 [Aspergillus flavus NRRL3357]|nr:hypothetical protein AFLA_004934 [Aspergillus flavus NRRL3357]